MFENPQIFGESFSRFFLHHLGMKKPLTQMPRNCLLSLICHRGGGAWVRGGVNLAVEKKSPLFWGPLLNLQEGIWIKKVNNNAPLSNNH